MISVFKKIVEKIRFRYSSAAYMRVAYIKPRAVAMITSRYNGEDNVMPMDWHMPVSISPKLYCISLEKTNHTQALIKSSGFFVVNFMPSELQEKVIACGQISGKAQDKFSALQLETKNAATVPVSVLKEAIGHLECEVRDVIETGDHLLVIGLVKHESMDTGLAKAELYHLTKF